MQISEIVSAVKSNKSSDGAFCKFVKLDERWGIKLYLDKDDRDEIFERQEEAARYGLGPEVGDCLDISQLDLPFGYITEIIEPAFDPKDFNYVHEEDAAEKKFIDENYDEIREVHQKLHQKLRWSFMDDHLFNWGYKNGKLMPLDFGR